MERYLTSLYLSLLTYKAGSSNSSYFRVRDHLEEGLTERKCSSASLLLLFQFSSVASDSLQPHRLQQARPLCPSPTPRVHPNPCPLCRWCHPTISSSVVPFSSCLQSFPALGSFQMKSALGIRWPKYWSFSFNISPSNEHSELISFRMNWLDLLAVSPRDSQESSPTHSSKASILRPSAFFTVQLSHPYMTTAKIIFLTI